MDINSFFRCIRCSSRSSTTINFVKTGGMQQTRTSISTLGRLYSTNGSNFIHSSCSSNRNYINVKSNLWLFGNQYKYLHSRNFYGGFIRYPLQSNYHNSCYKNYTTQNNSTNNKHIKIIVDDSKSEILTEEDDIKTKTNNSEINIDNSKRSLFQKIKHAMTRFMQGCKLLFLDVRQAWKIRGKLKGMGNDVSGLTRTELHHMRKTSTDVVKTLPVTFVAMLPFIGYAAPVLAFLFPRQLLSSHFWLPEQKEKFAKEDHDKRSQYYIPLLKEVGWSGKDVESNELTAFCIKLIDGGNATNTEVKRFKTLFREQDLSLKGMPRFHLVKLCKTWLAPAKWYMPRGLLRELLAYRVRRIIEDDTAIRRDGVSSLYDTEVAQACHKRGLEEAPHSPECLRNWLCEWIELTSHTYPARDISYVAHCAIFKSVNFKCEDSQLEDVDN